MIDYINFKVPGDSRLTEMALRLICDEFGKEEELLERRQLSGGEADYNLDYLFCAVENEKMLGTIHLTVNKKNCELGMLGGLVTAPESRGRGVATKLFGGACELFDSLGGKLLLLGTETPMAARIYEKFGFKFISGTNIMARIKDGYLYDFYRELYSGRDCEICDMDDGCRVPIIPLIASRTRDILMDANASIVNNMYLTQISCAGLYMRFIKIMENGAAKTARLKNQAVAAILTEMKNGDVRNLDLFAYSGFEHILHKMLSEHIRDGIKYSALVCKKDADKLELLRKFGFEIKRDKDFEFHNIRISCYYLER